MKVLGPVSGITSCQDIAFTLKRAKARAKSRTRARVRARGLSAHTNMNM